MRDKVLHRLRRDIREQLEVLKPASEQTVQCTGSRKVHLTHDITLAGVDRRHRRLCSDLLGLLRQCNGLLLPGRPLVEDISLALSLPDTPSVFTPDYRSVATEGPEWSTHTSARAKR